MTKQILTKAFNKAGMWFLLIVCAMVYANGSQEVKTFDKPEPVGTLADVLSKNDCKPPKEGIFPTAVIAREIGGGFHFLKGKAVGKALDEDFADKDWKGFDSVYYCR